VGPGNRSGGVAKGAGATLGESLAEILREGATRGEERRRERLSRLRGVAVGAALPRSCRSRREPWAALSKAGSLRSSMPRRARRGPWETRPRGTDMGVLRALVRAVGGAAGRRCRLCSGVWRMGQDASSVGSSEGASERAARHSWSARLCASLKPSAGSPCGETATRRFFRAARIGLGARLRTRTKSALGRSEVRTCRRARASGVELAVPPRTSERSAVAGPFGFDGSTTRRGSRRRRPAGQGDLAGERGGLRPMSRKSPRPQRSGGSIRVAPLDGSTPAAAGRWSSDDCPAAT
jgi:hypothetical protein